MSSSSGTSLAFFLVALAAGSTIASAKEACHDAASCENAASGSALLQTKKSAEGVKIHTVEHSTAPLAAALAPAHMAESQACIPAQLQEAHLSAIRYHASLLSTGARTATGRQVPERPGKRFLDACDGKSTNDVCEVMIADVPLPGKCHIMGMDAMPWCDIGQFEACGMPGNSDNYEGKACTVFGTTGQCEGVTGYPEFDQYNNPVNTVTVYACNMAQESTLVYPPGQGGPAPTFSPEPEPETGAGGLGSTAALDAAGFKAVTSLCCPQEMESFFNRLLDMMGMVPCSKPHIQGLMHWFTCVPDMDFQYLVNVINNGNPCKYWGAKPVGPQGPLGGGRGQGPLGAWCPVLTPQCEGTWCR